MKWYLFLILCSLVLTLFPIGDVEAQSPVNGAWWGDYFDNPDLEGGPAMSRYDEHLDFDWARSGPGGGLPSDNFSARWVKDEWFAGGTYRFQVLSDDGFRIWLDDRLLLDEWHDRWAEPLAVDRYIAEGLHHLRVEYYDRTGDATFHLNWHRLTGGATWYGEYFSNRDLQGWPTFTRDDPTIDFDWGDGSPDPAIPADDFSVRWRHTLEFEAGTYRFYADSDDGVRLWVDEVLVVDAWQDQSRPNTHTGDITLAAGQHSVTVEYYEHGGGASIRVWWQPLDSYAVWQGEYFANREFKGGPVMVRGDNAVDFDWGNGPPVSWMPDDDFAVRWTRQVSFPDGCYRFAVQADDGVRFWLDQSLLIDKWEDMDYELHHIGTCLQGVHTLRVEYYEHTGRARIRFWWGPDPGDNLPPAYPGVDGGAGAASTVAAGGTTTTGSATPSVPAVDPWQAVYFDNPDLRGEPVLTRAETYLAHDWGWGSPGNSLPADGFSARWTQTVHFERGMYRFVVHSDDGVRLWVDGRLLLDAWRPMRGTLTRVVWLSGGGHEVRLEYYEQSGRAQVRLTWRRLGR